VDWENVELIIALATLKILCRRGPGSLYLYLKRRGWIPDTAINSLPKISIPVDVSGFQIIKLELLLTIEGFVNRGSVANAVFESIKTVRTVGTPLGLPRNLMTQYASVAKLFGYHLAPRPPDAVELAFDALVYNHDEVCSGLWYRFPTSLGLIQRTVSETVDWMCEPDNALIIVTASGKTLKLLSISDNTRRWLTEPISGASFDFDDAAYQRSSLQSLVSETVGQQELLPPFFNPLIPNVLGRPEKRKDSVPAVPPLVGEEVVQGWQLVKLQSLEGIFLPRQPIDSEYGRCAFVVQLLSSKPARASVRQAARGELWKVLFEASITDLTELGASGGLAYDISFNKFGIRFAFLGVNQTLPSYVRRMFRRLLEFRQQMLQQLGDNPADLAKARSVAISSARSARGLSPGRRARIISNLRTASFLDVGTEGSELINSITGVVAISQGNFEAAMDVVKDLDFIFAADASIGKFGPPMMSLTSMSELCYKPYWKPRFASGCYVPGVNLMSDACGRITR
jgi:insulysin